MEDTPAKGSKSAAKSSKKRAHDSEDEGAARSAKRARADSVDSAPGASSGAPLYIAPIAVPLAGPKLGKRVHKVVKKAAGAKLLRRGVKEVVKALRKGEKGLVVLAGDISPLDVISHIPVLAEDCAVPYIFVASKAELGAAAGTKRPTSVTLITNKTAKGADAGKAWDGADKLAAVIAEAQALAPKTH